MTDRVPSLKIFDVLAENETFKRFLRFDAEYGSLPRENSARVQLYHYEIAPGGYTGWHLHNGATFFLVLQGTFEAQFEDGTVLTAQAGDVYSEPIGKVHRGHNPHATIANVGVGISLTSPDRDPVTNVASPFAAKE